MAETKVKLLDNLGPLRTKRLRCKKEIEQELKYCKKMRSEEPVI
jgi:hypothetical protein